MTDHRFDDGLYSMALKIPRFWPALKIHRVLSYRGRNVLVD